jgi:tetratricopeptide (TPR) repeat protein
MISVLLGLLLLATACSSAGAGSSEADPTITPRPDETTSTPLPATSTAMPSRTSAIQDTRDFRLGQQALENEEYEEAVSIFQRIYQNNPDNETAQIALADALRHLGVHTVNTSNAEPQNLDEAISHFGSGLRVAPEDSEVSRSLEWEQTGVQLYLQGIRDRQELDRMQAEDADILAQIEQMEEVLGSFAEAANEYQHLPGLIPGYAEVLGLAAELHLRMADDQEGREKRMPHWEQAQQYCKTARDLFEADSEAAQPYAGCVTEVGLKITPPTPTPVPPTPVPQPVRPAQPVQPVQPVPVQPQPQPQPQPEPQPQPQPQPQPAPQPRPVPPAQGGQEYRILR